MINFKKLADNSVIDLSLSDGLKVDKWIFSSMVMLFFFSIISVYSATNESISLIQSHIFKIVAAIIFFVIFSRVRVTYFRQVTVSFYIVTVLLLLIVLFVGQSKMGAQRWLNLGLFSFQPSEFAKISVPMLCALMVSYKGLFDNFKSFSLAIVAILVPCVAVFLQPDLGTAVLIFISGVVVVFIGGLSWVFLGWLISLLALASPLSWFYILKDYQKERVISSFNPELDPLGSGYHVIQSKAAIGSGGSNGVGWLGGTQSHLGFIPEQHTDFIFAVIGEEFGFTGFALLISTYLVVLMRLLYIIINTEDIYGKCLCAGVMAMLFSYLIVNIAMVTGMFPVVGVPLPLISFGGTSTISIAISLGFCSAYSMQNRKRS